MDDAQASPASASKGFGLHHTEAWQNLHGRLQRLFLLYDSSASWQDRTSLTTAFAGLLIQQANEEAKEFSAEARREVRHGLQLIGLALLVVATSFDTALNQEIAPRVKDILTCGAPQDAAAAPLAELEHGSDASLASALSMFMLQASSVLGVTPPLAHDVKSPVVSPSTWRQPPPGKGADEHDVSASPMIARRAILPRNGSELFAFEQ